MKRIILILAFLYFLMHDAFAQFSMCGVTRETKAIDNEVSINTYVIYIVLLPNLFLIKQLN